MKYLQFFGLVTLISALTFAGCSKDDEKPLLDNEFYPTNFNLLKVTDGAGDVDLNPVLEWQESKDPNDEGIYYDVYLDKNQQPTTKI